MILVTGATGNVGAELVQALGKVGQRVRALTRGESGRPAVAGADVVVGDLDRPRSLTAALDGVSGVFLLSGYRDMPGLLAEIRQAGVTNVVLLSEGSAETPDPSNAITSDMVRSENAVRESGVSWTILRPHALMSNTLRWVPQLRTGDVVRAPFAEVSVSVIDPYDVAEVAALALTNRAHKGHTYRITGPHALRAADRVRALARVLGRDLRFQAQSDAEARVAMSRTMTTEYVDALFRFYVGGTHDESTVYPTVREVTGRPPRTFEQWANAHAHAFQLASGQT